MIKLEEGKRYTRRDGCVIVISYDIYTRTFFSVDAMGCTKIYLDNGEYKASGDHNRRFDIIGEYIFPVLFDPRKDLWYVPFKDLSEKIIAYRWIEKNLGYTFMTQSTEARRLSHCDGTDGCFSNGWVVATDDVLEGRWCSEREGICIKLPYKHVVTLDGEPIFRDESVYTEIARLQSEKEDYDAKVLVLEKQIQHLRGKQ